MQTFLPYEDFVKTATVLDRQRLGKQRVETLQVLKALVTPNYGWRNHPAVKMWRNYEFALLDYQKAICNEWVNRGYKDTCFKKSEVLLDNYPRKGFTPYWLGNPVIHKSHQSNLLRKLPEHYSQYFNDVPNNLDYYWPKEAK